MLSNIHFFNVYLFKISTDGMVHNDMDARSVDNRNEDIVRNDDGGVHTDDGAVHKDNSVRDDVDSNHDKDKNLESFTHLLSFSPFTL